MFVIAGARPCHPVQPARSPSPCCSFCSPAARPTPRPRPSSDRPVQVQRVAFESERRRARVRRRGAGALRDRSRLPRRRQDRRRASSMSAIACAPATWWRGSIRRTSTLQVESAEAELAAATSNLAQAAADLERYTTLKRTGLRLDRRLRPQEGGEGRGRRPARARQARARSRAQSARLCRSQGRRRRRDHGDAGRGRPGRRDRPGGGAARPSRREGSRGRAARDLARRGAQVEGDRAAVVGPRPQLHGAAARALAAGRRRDPHLRGALHHRGRRRHRRVRHDRDRDAVARRPTHQVARLPLSAILNRGSGPSVYVVDEAARWCCGR